MNKVNKLVLQYYFKGFLPSMFTFLLQYLHFLTCTWLQKALQYSPPYCSRFWKPGFVRIRKRISWRMVEQRSFLNLPVSLVITEHLPVTYWPSWSKGFPKVLMHSNWFMFSAAPGYLMVSETPARNQVGWWRCSWLALIKYYFSLLLHAGQNHMSVLCFV